jgi:hypothetical protein
MPIVGERKLLIRTGVLDRSTRHPCPVNGQCRHAGALQRIGRDSRGVERNLVTVLRFLCGMGRAADV